MNLINFTVAIPTYNGVNRFPKVLEYLQKQTEVEKLTWEIIIVDNNSTDDTAKVVHDFQKTWNKPYPLRYIFEPEQGAGFARQRAIVEARGEIVGFLDDDNLPAPNWIIEAFKFAIAHSQVGAYASQIHGIFEVEPPEDIKPILFYLAITERGDKPHIYEPSRKGFPPSAGLVVRRNAWIDNVPHRLFLVGRVGSSMLGSEDAEALLYIHRAGWEIWYNPKMEVDHIIPSWRLEKDYLISLMRGIGLARYHLRMLLLKTWQRPFAFCIYFTNDFRKLLFYFFKKRKSLKSNIVAACEMERLTSTLASPFFLLLLRTKRFAKLSAFFTNQIF
ncbi:hormogonium polysaccharide biosynthesis glycosyltransferase HpsE [Iningainema tapete]|uniref:Glycosyltransferase family 2 protein n=1 Tax=Iningainema tapete BLCC-T55 TaxID=2748662 RepID=A0A8J7BWA0_9CYAN|nr:hormogonium polysaccharide biosynthesis glycosyltransferase HpsE [Iningainema tapete]MBD2771467.1 glycosyltransferase family 2 protein [Iningainema tapete BLCC-T55]